jgi:hypothetical protein
MNLPVLIPAYNPDLKLLFSENIHDYIASGGYEAAKSVLLTLIPEQVINEIKKNAQDGRGNQRSAHDRSRESAAQGVVIGPRAVVRLLQSNERPGP